jgi:hypothetical protein
VWQYKTDRLPKAVGQAPEPLLSFPSGALVHFAVSNREVQMTTRLEGTRTAYLWEEVWERESWLEILGRYCIAERDKTKQIKRLVLPTVLVVSDRSVIDSQLQETLENFERRKGVVASITSEKGIKSEQLAAPIAARDLRSIQPEGLRQDAVSHCLQALQLFEGMDQQRFIEVLSQVTAVGQGGLQINEPGTARSPKNLPGSWSDLALACLIHVYMKRLTPDDDSGLGIEAEYQEAVWLLNRHCQNNAQAA